MTTSRDVSAKLSANSAIKIRAALSQMFDSHEVVDGYMHTHPTSNNLTQDRARARAWALVNVYTKTDSLRSALKNHYANMYALGLNEGNELMAKALRARKKGTITARINHSHAKLPQGITPIDAGFVMDWANWTPGSEAAALLLSPPGGLASLLNGIDIKGLVNTSLDQLGTQLADGLNSGLTATQIARSIDDMTSSSSRSLTISLTEGTRAMVEANRQSFQEQGVQQWEWSVNDPDDADCLDVDGEVQDIGTSFTNGEDQPPVHPNCQCSVLPVMPDLSAFGDVNPDVTGYEDVSNDG